MGYFIVEFKCRDNVFFFSNLSSHDKLQNMPRTIYKFQGTGPLSLSSLSLEVCMLLVLKAN